MNFLGPPALAVAEADGDAGASPQAPPGPATFPSGQISTAVAATTGGFEPPLQANNPSHSDPATQRALIHAS